MAAIGLDRLDLHPDIKKRLKSGRLKTTHDVLLLSEAELIRSTRLSEAYARDLLRSASKASLGSEIIPSAQLVQGKCPPEHEQMKLTLCPNLGSDSAHNFILTRTVTEITGASSSGKTQLCLQLALQAQLPVDEGGLGSKVAMICTEEPFPSRRFQQIAQCFQKDNPKYRDCNFSDNLMLCHLANLEQMVRCLEELLPPMLNGPVKILIIDSIAGLFRGQYEDNEGQKRTQDITRIGHLLWKISQEHGVAVVCVNQVSSTLESTGSNNNLVPTLGLTWSNVLTTRIMLSRTDKEVKYKGERPTTLRSLKTIFSPYLPNFIRHYIIHESGVVFLEQNQLEFA